MPRSIPNFRRSIHRSSRRTSFHRQHPQHDRSPFHVPDRPPPLTTNRRPFLRSTRSFPNLTTFANPNPDLSQTSHESDASPQTFQSSSFPEPPEIVDCASSHDLFRFNSPIPQSNSAQPLSTSTISTASSLSAHNHPLHSPGSPTRHQMTYNQRNSHPSRSRNLLRRVSSSQRIRRLSLSHRARSRTSRCSSFSDRASPWASSGASFLSQRSDTDDSLSWSRYFPSSTSDLRDQRMWRKRHSSYSCSDFEVAEEDNLVEIGIRLPDRADSIAEEDIFGRRRGDVAVKNTPSISETSAHPSLACETNEATTSSEDVFTKLKPKPKVRASATVSENRYGFKNRVAPVVVNEEERTIETISRAIDSSRGRLRRSANMSKAFKAVIKSGEGFVRKSELVQATLNSEESNDPSMIILLHPESCDLDKSDVESTGKQAEEEAEGVSDEKISTTNGMAEGSIGFSTSMTAKQCAATLETILRDMSCKVLRYAEDRYGSRKTIRLKATRLPHGGRILDRKIRIMVTIREEDDIRTSVAFRKISGLYSSRDSHLPLCCEIRDRFQREWPAIVEALYIRLPNVERNASSLR